MRIDTNTLVSVLTALFAGGFLMLTIENLHLSSAILDRYYSIMKPFYHKLTNYIKLMSHIRHHIRYDKTKSEYIEMLEGLIKQITIDGSSLIESGLDIQIDKYKASELDDLCENRINNVWYLISEKRNYVAKGLYFNEHDVNNVAYEYLTEITNKYKGKTINLELIADLSGYFYTDIYQPIHNIPYEYEYWQSIEKKFKNTNIVSMSFNLVSILVLAFGGFYLNKLDIAGITMVGITIVNVLLFVFVFSLFIKMDNKSRNIVRN